MLFKDIPHSGTLKGLQQHQIFERHVHKASHQVHPSRDCCAAEPCNNGRDGSEGHKVQPHRSWRVGKGRRQPGGVHEREATVQNQPQSFCLCLQACTCTAEDEPLTSGIGNQDTSKLPAGLQRTSLHTRWALQRAHRRLRMPGRLNSPDLALGPASVLCRQSSIGDLVAVDHGYQSCSSQSKTSANPLLTKQDAACD